MFVQSLAVSNSSQIGLKGEVFSFKEYIMSVLQNEEGM